jgi:hypothetical protein
MGIERPWFGAATELRVIVCGGRFFRDVPLIWRTLDRINAECRISPLIDGASDDVTGPYVGADYWAHQWALAHDVSTIRQRGGADPQSDHARQARARSRDRVSRPQRDGQHGGHSKKGRRARVRDRRPMTRAESLSN